MEDDWNLESKHLC